MSATETEVQRSSFMDNLTAMAASEVKEKAALPEPVVTTDVVFQGENSEVVVTLRFPLNFDPSLAYKAKKSLVIGEIAGRIPITFQKENVEGNMESYNLTLEGNPVSLGAARLVVYQEDKKAAETAAAQTDVPEEE